MRRQLDRQKFNKEGGLSKEYGTVKTCPGGSLAKNEQDGEGRLGLHLGGGYTIENFKDVPIQDQSTGADPNIGLSRSRFYIFVGKTTDWGTADGYLQPRVTGTADMNSGSNYPFSIGGGLPGPSSQYETGGSAADTASDSNPPTPYDTIYDEFHLE